MVRQIPELFSHTCSYGCAREVLVGFNLPRRAGAGRGKILLNLEPFTVTARGGVV